MSRRLVDELGPEDDGGDHAGDEADGPDDDVEVGQVHLAPQVPAQAEEDEAEGEDEDAHSNHKVDCHHPHLAFPVGSLVPASSYSSKWEGERRYDRGWLNTCG